jgi:outer membrane lipoprotein-sorting protein
MSRVIGIVVAGWLCGSAWAGTLTPVEIVRRCDDLLRGEESYCRLTMTITRPSWSRTVAMEAWTRGTEDSFIRVLAPPKEQGVTFLKKKREAWQYAPSIDRVIKIPPSMMLQSWLGSDFTNDDVVRADSIVVDYDHVIASEPEEDGVAYWVIEARPKPAAPVVWGRVDQKIRKQDFIPVRVAYYDEDGALVKFYETADFSEVEGRRLAMRMTMHDQSRPGHSTEIRYGALTFKPDLRPDTFTVQNLRR